ncbi:hypothetical protein IFM89_030914 [Coptis chinensis]|uniref:TF-B3 domain-containing protein n=1 Tax=Coptis chinensis TaxID=261450 RepID=A0A835HT55_9MAGN|nr:hypothetical protein IFM89_030914 [Coptis chinensis]
MSVTENEIIEIESDDDDRQEEDEEEDYDDEMTLAQFSRSRRRRSNCSSTTSTTPKPLSMVVFNQAEQMVSDQTETSPRYKNNQALDDHDKAVRCALERAEEVQANLEPDEYPSFVKTMLRSHVASGFWLRTRKRFQLSSLPKKTGLSAGWREFSIAHGLVEGDALIFQLVKPNVFKVYIIRAYGLGAIDGQNAFLHDKLLEGISTKLAAGAISQAVDIADDIKSRFLSAQGQRLLSISIEYEMSSKCYSVAILEQACVQDELRNVKAKVSKLEKASKKLTKSLKTKARSHELKYEAEANCPW